MQVPHDEEQDQGPWLPTDMKVSKRWEPRYSDAVIRYIEQTDFTLALDDFLDTVGVGSQSTAPPADHVRRMHDQFTPAQVYRQQRESAEWAYYVDMHDLNDLLNGHTAWDDDLRRHMSDWLVQHGTAAAAIRFADLAGHPDLSSRWQDYGSMGWIDTVMIGMSNRLPIDAYRELWNRVTAEQNHGANRGAWARDWAKRRFPVGDRGRLPAAIVRQYEVDTLGFDATEPERSRSRIR